jgi:RNA methyltransferase, TrmH family
MLSKNHIKEIQYLHLKKHRDSLKLFLVEGVKTVNEVLATQPKIIKHLYCTKEFNRKYLPEFLVERCETITNEELMKISLQKNPNQVLCVCRYLKSPIVDFNFNQNFSLYLDDIRDPGNFGTIIRLANWYGIKKIYASPSSCDLYNPKVIQSSMGAFLRVEIVYIDLKELTNVNKINHIYGAVLNGETLYNSNLQNGLIVIGNEANGINESNLKLISHPITIPAANAREMESLNAAIAASIITSEFYRQVVCKTNS